MSPRSPQDTKSLFTQRTLLIIIGALAIALAATGLAFAATGSTAGATLVGLGVFLATLERLNHLVD